MYYMRDLIKKILKESEDDFGWAEDIVDNTNVYQLKGNAFIRFMNQYFQTHPSPNEGRIYEIVLDNEDNRYYMLIDHTGNYFSIHKDDMSLTTIIYHIEEVLNRFRGGIYYGDTTILNEFKDLYATIKPLIDSIN